MYKLINLETKEEFICEKVIVDGYEYYYGIEIPINGEWAIYNNKQLVKTSNISNPLIHKKVIATNNPSLDIPQIVDEVDEMANSANGYLVYAKNEKAPIFKEGFIKGYNKAKEQTPYSKQDMIEFAEWKDKLSPSEKVSVWSKNGEWKGLFNMDNEQLLEKFENSRPKTIYFK